MSFSNIDNRKQMQRKKKNFINIMQSYLLPHTQIVKKKRNMFKSEGVQVSWDLIHTIFVELFTADLLKKIKILSFVCAKIFTE